MASYNYDMIKAISEGIVAGRNTHQFLIDVRRSDEISKGMIPGAKPICLSDLSSVLELSPENFQQKYNFPKFNQEQDELIFYCLAGGRASNAAQIAISNGFQKVGVYPGSWNDWSSHL